MGLGLTSSSQRKAGSLVRDVASAAIVFCIQPIVFCTWPVSYTHLRAHETRSNLVCRLLLEKKKPYINHEARIVIFTGGPESIYSTLGTRILIETHILTNVVPSYMISIRDGFFPEVRHVSLYTF